MIWQVRLQRLPLTSISELASEAIILFRGWLERLGR
jgi:hypothetical protein